MLLGDLASIADDATVAPRARTAADPHATSAVVWNHPRLPAWLTGAHGMMGRRDVAAARAAAPHGSRT
ncbi:MAG: hypothetical protein KGS47_12275 [Chloroflexi bacterium]|nr:hypothetical protein [Chloroflexota bacterium]